MAIRPYKVLVMTMWFINLKSAVILVTHNVREFSRIEGLKIEDWEAE